MLPLAEHQITITVSAAMYAELVEAARQSSEEENILTPETFAQQSVESVLASRRLARMFPHE